MLGGAVRWIVIRTLDCVGSFGSPARVAVIEIAGVAKKLLTCSREAIRKSIAKNGQQSPRERNAKADPTQLVRDEVNPATDN